ncbi:MAG: RidA family protein [Rhodospirillaceae bacterium]
MDIERVGPGAWNSRAVVHGNVAWLSGIVADDRSLGVQEQTAQVLAKIDAILAQLGTDKTRILSSVVYMADLGEKEAMNAAWMSWMDPAHPPARAAVGATLTDGITVEIMVQAAVG